RPAVGLHVARRGAVVVLPNDQSCFDPVLVGLAIPRYVTWLPREALHKNQRFSRLITTLGSIPIDHRGFSREGLQRTLDALRGGAWIGMFPERRRTYGGTLERFRPGG